ncbi:hypothetical protein EDC01DRAFT_429401 [Geopyxis carbonaria]|nr:hypothetical protein EDC01DRAFT_429401 [Geopyxis carbonaria]
MKSSTTGSSKYRIHTGSDINPAIAQRRSSRHKVESQDHLISYSPSNTPGPGAAPDYNLYDSYNAYESRRYASPPPLDRHQSYEGSHSVPHHPHNVYATSPHAHYSRSPRGHPPFPGYAPAPIPSPQHGHHGHHSVSYSTPTQHHGSYPIPAQSHHPPPLHPSHSSELSQYSLSHYKPTKPRFRIEHEGNSLVVLPPGEHQGVIQTSPPSVPSPPPEQAPVKSWPPSPYQTDICESDVQQFVARGAPRFRGELREISNGPRGSYHFFAIAGEEWDEETDTAPFQSDSFGDMSSSPEGRQTDALERPAMGHAFGIYPGTVTLAYYVAGFGSELKGSEIAARGKVRKLTMLYVLDRLRTLQVKGIEEDIMDLHDHLYEYLLHDNHKYDHPETSPSLDSQIGDLVAALCRPSWVDFSLTENQTVAHFLANDDTAVSNSFFHQLLLSIELYLRINARDVTKPLADMPEKIRWDLMLAQRWLENVEIEPPRKVVNGKGKRGEQKSSVGFKFPNKMNQIEALRNFAWTLKWPNMAEVEYTLSEEEDPNELLEDRSSNCMSWFTGLLLPGKSMPFILMNSLVDCDIDTPKEFKNLQQTELNIGFQYRGCTYWSWECIVGKVLGAASGVTQIAGWVGPCSASADLERSEVAKINQTRSKCNKIAPSDIRNMASNSDPIGPQQDSYPVSDYNQFPMNTDERPVDSIRIERLNFSPASCNPPGIHRQVLEHAEAGHKKPIVIFDASITFAITLEQRARSWKVSLRHDTPFISAYPCQDGPHVLFCEYAYQQVRVDELVEIQNWGSSGSKDSDIDDDSDDGETPTNRNEVEEVLVVGAFGVPDNEVFARAWCSFWGLPSITADISRTCPACAIREAYAALVSVVILVDRNNVDVEIEEVDRLMENL